jgi:hypothetical protein
MNISEEYSGRLSALSAMFVLLISICMPASLLSQIKLTCGVRHPADARYGDFFYNTDAHAIVFFDGQHWIANLSYDIVKATTCHDFLLLTLADGQQILMQGHFKIPCNEMTSITCHPGLIELRNEWWHHWLDAAGNLQSLIPREDFKGGQLVKLGTQTGFCLPQVTDDIYWHTGTWSDLRTWGFLSVQGEWLIEPKFDEPFYFVDGIAEVVYYGQKREINEEGEFVQ